MLFFASWRSSRSRGVRLRGENPSEPTGCGARDLQRDAFGDTRVLKVTPVLERLRRGIVAQVFGGVCRPARCHDREGRVRLGEAYDEGPCGTPVRVFAAGQDPVCSFRCPLKYARAEEGFDVGYASPDLSGTLRR